jgi:hypothetical protein
MSLLKIKIPSKNMRKNNKYTNYSFGLLIMYGSSYMFRHYIAILRERSYCLLRDVQIEEQSIEYCGWEWDGARTTPLDTNTPIHNILSTAPQLSMSQK